MNEMKILANIILKKMEHERNEDICKYNLREYESISLIFEKKYCLFYYTSNN